MENRKINSLMNWTEVKNMVEIDAILEWLGDNDFLNTKGKKFAHEYYKETWKLEK